MTDAALVAEKNDIENKLSHKKLNFSGAYMLIKNLDFLIKKAPDHISEGTIPAITSILTHPGYGGRRQAYFLYREAAGVLVRMADQSKSLDVTERVTALLRNILRESSGDRHRAVAETLGSFPLRISGPLLPELPKQKYSSISWDELISRHKLSMKTTGKWMGRSLVFETDDGTLLVLKTVKADDDTVSLEGEAVWMNLLAKEKDLEESPDRFHIPSPISLKGRYLFTIKGLPAEIPEKITVHPQRLFLCYLCDPDYFVYPNELPLPDGAEFLSIISHNARLLGTLAAKGIMHTAPIPLFHNRVQGSRRSDGGLYEWDRGGRLDGWLSSSAYPNFGASGLRDFEHFESISHKTNNLYRQIGSHIMSLVLVSGSYFRNKNPERAGHNKNGEPVITWDLFDPDLFSEILEKIFSSYYTGFTGEPYMGEFPSNISSLTRRLIHEMGQDTHMEEILRARDQKSMSQEEFNVFLTNRGLSINNIKDLKQGEKDISIQTGPHLGGFNQKISLPELICFLAEASSFCISGRYLSNIALSSSRQCLPGLLKTDCNDQKTIAVSGNII